MVQEKKERRVKLDGAIVSAVGKKHTQVLRVSLKAPRFFLGSARDREPTAHDATTTNFSLPNDMPTSNKKLKNFSDLFFPGRHKM